MRSNDQLKTVSFYQILNKSNYLTLIAFSANFHHILEPHLGLL